MQTLDLLYNKDRYKNDYCRKGFLEAEQRKECTSWYGGGHVCEELVRGLCVDPLKMFFELLRTTFLCTWGV